MNEPIRVGGGFWTCQSCGKEFHASDGHMPYGQECHAPPDPDDIKLFSPPATSSPSAPRTLTDAERVAELEALLNTPEIEDFDKAVPLEAAHQVIRWGAAHDAGKNPEDWFWLVGYLAGKALAAQKVGDMDKAKHHCISASAALRNWHAHLRSGESVMRPGIEAPIESAAVRRDALEMAARVADRVADSYAAALQHDVESIRLVAVAEAIAGDIRTIAAEIEKGER